MTFVYEILRSNGEPWAATVRLDRAYGLAEWLANSVGETFAVVDAATREIVTTVKPKEIA